MITGDRMPNGSDWFIDSSLGLDWGGRFPTEIARLPRWERYMMQRTLAIRARVQEENDRLAQIRAHAKQ